MPLDSDQPKAGLVRGLIRNVSLWAGMVAVATMFGIGAWQRRWIADDGLIVLRTVRNLLAGNGPVFNAGERVESNTSTAWTYLIWFFSWLTNGQTEYVVLYVAMVLSVAALPIAMFATSRLLRGFGGSGGYTLLLPLGALIYIALPPARDFATSGLEVSLCIFWISVLWLQLVLWSQRDRDASGWRPVVGLLLIAFNGGLSVLVRPELAIVGALALALVFLSPMTWKMRAAFFVVAAALPVGYQIFRMGYYAILVPNTAIAKDASGSKFKQGFSYVANLFGPYWLVTPVVIAVVAGIVVAVMRSRSTSPVERPSSRTFRQRITGLSEGLRSPQAVVAFAVVAGLIEAFYWIRQGGDFMHGRVLLAPLYLLALPVMVIPVGLPTRVAADGGRLRVDVRRVVGAGALAVMWIVTVVWSLNTAQSAGMKDGTEIGRSGIVDERRFYIQNVGIEHPVTAEDYLNFPRMRPMVEKLAEQQRGVGGVLLPSANFDEWYFVRQPDKLPPGVPKQVSVYFLNLGMTSMNLPLNVRVVDQMGLAYPLASHTERLDDARIGHDKDLDAEWVIAETGAVSRRPGLPVFLDEDWVQQAREALKCEQTVKLRQSYTDGWSWQKFKTNLRQSSTLTGYRIDRVPMYELQRCKLPVPPRIHPRSAY